MPYGRRSYKRSYARKGFKRSTPYKKRYAKESTLDRAVKAHARLQLLASSEDLSQPGVVALHARLSAQRQADEDKVDLKRLLAQLVEGSQLLQAAIGVGKVGEHSQQPDSPNTKHESSGESTPTEEQEDCIQALSSQEEECLTTQLNDPGMTKQEKEETTLKCESTSCEQKPQLHPFGACPVLCRRVTLQLKDQLAQRGSHSKLLQHIASASIRKGSIGTSLPGDL